MDIDELKELRDKLLKLREEFDVNKDLWENEFKDVFDNLSKLHEEFKLKFGDLADLRERLNLMAPLDDLIDLRKDLRKKIIRLINSVNIKLFKIHRDMKRFKVFFAILFVIQFVTLVMAIWK